MIDVLPPPTDGARGAYQPQEAPVATEGTQVGLALVLLCPEGEDWVADLAAT